MIGAYTARDTASKLAALALVLAPGAIALVVVTLGPAPIVMVDERTIDGRPKAEGAKAEGAKAEGVKAEGVKAENVNAESVGAKPERVEADGVRSDVAKRERVAFGLDAFGLRPSTEAPLSARSLISYGTIAPAVGTRIPAASRKPHGLASAFARTGRAIGTAFQKTGAHVADAFRFGGGS
jgi:hypothetical protein